MVVTENRILHGFSLPLKSTPGMQFSVTTGRPLQKPSMLKGRIIKFTKDNLHYVQVEFKQILLSPSAWLNNNTMDAVLKLIYKELGNQHYQSVEVATRGVL